MKALVVCAFYFFERIVDSALVGNEVVELINK